MEIAKKQLQFIVILVIALLSISCEKVVELDLDNAQQMLVVEALVHDSVGDNYVLISKSKSFNDNEGKFEKVSGATVIISDSDGNNFNLSESKTGYYNNQTLKGVPGRTYRLSITVEGKEITAESLMPANVNLDSLSYEESNSPFGDEEDTEGKKYRVYTHFMDPLGVENFYRIKAFNGYKQEKGFISLNNDLFEGDDVDFPLFLSKFIVGDTATVQLLSVDEANYRYFNAIESSQEGEVPGNPESNLEGENVVGYFGAYAKSQKSIAIYPL